MFKDMDTVAILYISKSRYKLVTMARETGHPRSVNQYDPSSNKIYQYMAGANEGFYTESPNLEGKNYKKKLSKKAGEVTLLDPNCSSMVITDAASESIVFFSRKFKVDPKTINADAPLFLRFIREAGALPLKIIMSGGGAIHSLVYEARSIVEEELPDSEFPVPKRSRD